MIYKLLHQVQLLNLKTLAIFFLRLNTLAELVALQLFTIVQFCSVLAISDLGAKHDFEIWAFKVFFFGQEKHPLEWLLDAQT